MNKYLFRARDVNGKLVAGAVFAENEAEATVDLRNKSYHIEYLVLSASVKSFVHKRELAAIGDLTTGFLEDVKSLFTRTPRESLALFYRQMAILSRAGFNLDRILEVLRKEIWPRHLSKALFEMSRGIKEGKSLSRLIGQFPHVFSPVYVSMMTVGENSGEMASALEKAAQLAEEESAISKRISAALIYPSFLLASFLLIFVLFVFFLVPQMEGIISSTNIKMPLLIQVTFGAIRLCSNPVVIIAAIEIFVVFVFVYYCWIKELRGKLFLDAALMRIPVLGNFLLNVGLSRCAFNLNLLMDSGLTMAKALETLPRAIGNEKLAQAIVTAKRDITEGSTLADSLEESGAFPRMFIQMIRVGEQTGELSSCIRNLSRFYEQEVEVALASFLNIFEPLIIIFMGILVAGVFLTFLPMINQLYRGIS